MKHDAFFEGRPIARLVDHDLQRMLESLGPVSRRLGKSRIAFRRRIAFAWAWTPDRYLNGPVAPLVLTLALRRRHPFPRWKQIVEPAPGRYTHHLELHAPSDIDPELMGWLRQAWEGAG